ncbi:MAG: hypothetical protein Q9171_002906 [Xanthocarpia ochracea]
MEQLPRRANTVRYMESPAIFSVRASQGVNHTNKGRLFYSDERTGDRLNKSHHILPEHARSSGPPTTYQPRRTVQHSKSEPAGKRRPGESSSVRHVRFDPGLPPTRYQTSESAPKGIKYSPQHPVLPSHKAPLESARKLPERLRYSKDKGVITPIKRIEELTREIGCLRQELMHYKETQAVLINFLQASKKWQMTSKSLLEDTIRDLSIAEQPLRDYWGLDSGGRDDVEQIF